MSAETLRNAAEKLRTLAKAAISAGGDDPWKFNSTGFDGMTYPVRSGPYVVAESGIEESAEYIATMHPGVGHAIADWLEAVADNAAVLGFGGEGQPGSPHARAHAVARLILGDAS